VKAKYFAFLYFTFFHSIMDYNKLLQLVTPTFLQGGFTVLLGAVATPLNTLYADFKLWQREIRLQTAITCQVMYLEFLLNDRLGTSGTTKIYITDGDGVERDFVVNMPSGMVLDFRLQAYLNKYKMAGKRYTIEQSNIAYAVNWTGWCCELVTPSYDIYWTGWYCELVDGRTDNVIRIYTDGEHAGQYLIIADTQVTSNLSVGVVFIFDGEANEIVEPNHTILAGDWSSGWINTPTMDGHTIVSINITSVLPVQDTMQLYRWYS